MTGHICIIFTMTMLSVYIFHYYSSNSITSNYIVFTGVKKLLSAVNGACTCVVRQSGQVDRRVQMSV